MTVSLLACCGRDFSGAALSSLSKILSPGDHNPSFPIPPVCPLISTLHVISVFQAVSFSMTQQTLTKPNSVPTDSTVVVVLVLVVKARCDLLTVCLPQFPVDRPKHTSVDESKRSIQGWPDQNAVT